MCSSDLVDISGANVDHLAQPGRVDRLPCDLDELVRGIDCLDSQAAPGEVDRQPARAAPGVEHVRAAGQTQRVDVRERALMPLAEDLAVESLLGVDVAPERDLVVEEAVDPMLLVSAHAFR